MRFTDVERRVCVSRGDNDERVKVVITLWADYLFQYYVDSETKTMSYTVNIQN